VDYGRSRCGRKRCTLATHSTPLRGFGKSGPCLLCKAPEAEAVWLATAWPPHGAKQHHAETLLGIVAFTERGASRLKSLDIGRYAFKQLRSCSNARRVRRVAAADQRAGRDTV
jgi:hypothetical protein